jgi:hypothetical protein
MKKIGIVSYYRINNYGSALQAYAMQIIIKKLGYDCEHIRCFLGRSNLEKIQDTVKNPLKILKKQFLIYKKKSILKKNIDREKKFSRFFDKNINESEIFYDKKNVWKTNMIYDAFVCGSDQIWAPNQFNEWFYINFVPEKHKKIAYAPSIGLSVVPEHLKAKIASLICDIEYLSIREKKGAEIVRELTGLDIPVVLDPTLLLDKNDWLAKIETTSAPKEPYLLCLFLGENPEHRRAAEAYGQAKGYKIAVIPFQKKDYFWGDIVLKDAGPLEFIDLINSAAMIFSDSFHGVAFALNLNKPFGAFMRFTEDDPICQNSRMRNLLNIFSLQDRLVKDDTSMDKLDMDINWVAVNKKLTKERHDSLTYLINAIEHSIAASH